MGSSGGGGSSSGNQTNTIRYAPYVEAKHTKFLDLIVAHRDKIIGSSPFKVFTPLDVNSIFLGAGMSIAAYGSMFGKHKTYMQDVNVDKLYSDIFTETVNSAEIKALVVAEGKLMDEEIEVNSYPRLMTGARDLNAVMSSTFVIGKSNIEISRVKSLSKFSAGLKYTMIPVALDRWKTTLEWNKGIVQMYAQTVQMYMAGTLDINEQKYAMYAKNTLWPFTVLDHERAALGAMQAAQTSKSVAGDGGPSTSTKVLGGALSGAAMGATVGSAVPVVGTAIGAVAGAVIGGLAGAFA
jgi:hypothetical protein